MKKNVILYILLIFLMVVNGFFFYHYIGASGNRKPRRPPSPTNFIAKELEFTPTQLDYFKESSQEHSEVMTRLSKEIRDLKDALFNQLSDSSTNDRAVDSITSLLGQKEKEKRTQVFYHFKAIQNICDEEQREKFNRIINDALHNPGDREQNPPVLSGAGERRPPPPPRK